MSCQHAMNLGRSAGHNVAADLLGHPTRPYRQPKYVTCLDLGPWGAVYTEGWDRQVKMKGAEAKRLKNRINTERIYPPRAGRDDQSSTTPRIDNKGHALSKIRASRLRPSRYPSLVSPGHPIQFPSHPVAKRSSP